MGTVALIISGLFGLVSIFGDANVKDETFYISMFFIGIALICFAIEGGKEGTFMHEIKKNIKKGV